MVSGAKCDAIKPPGHEPEAMKADPPMLAQRFVRPMHGRYYLGSPKLDLVGDLIVECWYGSLHSHRGGHRSLVVPDTAAAKKLIQGICRMRLRHGYQPDNL